MPQSFQLTFQIVLFLSKLYFLLFSKLASWYVIYSLSLW